MYAPFFGLAREPFSIAPDPRFLFMSERHREALAHLLYGVRGGGGFVLLTGEIGAGKTTVGRCFLEQLPAHCVVAYIFNPKLSVHELLQTICSEFGVAPPDAAASLKVHVDALNTFLLEAHAQGRQALLVIDEAQSLSVEVLEQLRLLTNLETAERKLLQIILIGQPELRTQLAAPGLEQLAQRVIARYHLGPLSRAETAQYITHRLAVAGPNAPVPFDAAALVALHRISGGVPRRINLLADRALLGAYSQGQHRVGRRTVAQAAREVFDTTTAPGAGVLWVRALRGAAVVCAVGAGVAGMWAWRSAADAAQAAAVARAAASAPPAAASVSAVVALSEAAAASAASAAPYGAASGVPPYGAASGVPPYGAASAVPPVLATAATASAPAPAVLPAPAPAPASAPLATAAAVLAVALADEATAWRELALHWNVAIGEGQACQVAPQAQLACFRSVAGGLPVLRQLARPAVLVLRGAQGQRAYALLVALGPQHATLQVGAQRFVLPLAALAEVWRGESATLWRTPSGWHEGVDAWGEPTLRAWIAAPVGAAADADRATLRERIAAFQLVQGLPPDGRAGPLTLMQLNRVLGVDEPRLDTTATR